MAKAKLSDLKTGTHKGRRARTGVQRPTIVNHPGGIQATGLKADPRLTSAALTQISPTPKGPEPHWPGGA